MTQPFYIIVISNKTLNTLKGCVMLCVHGKDNKL